MATKAICLYYIAPTSQCQIYFERDEIDFSRFSVEGCILQPAELKYKRILVECYHVVVDRCSFRQIYLQFSTGCQTQRKQIFCTGSLRFFNQSIDRITASTI